MKKQCMIASLLAVAVSGIDLLGAGIPFVEMEPDKFPSPSLVNFALVEVHDGFIHPQPERDNWTLFIPLLERVTKYRRSVAKEEVASVEAKILSRFTLYALSFFTGGRIRTWERLGFVLRVHPVTHDIGNRNSGRARQGFVSGRNTTVGCRIWLTARNLRSKEIELLQYGFKRSNYGKNQ